MKALQLKSNIHKIVEGIQNEQLLQSLYDFLKSRQKSETGKLWKTLTELQKQEVLLSFDESDDDENLIRKDQLFD